MTRRDLLLGLAAVSLGGCGGRSSRPPAVTFGTLPWGLAYILAPWDEHLAWGYYAIGSRSGTDDPAFNVTSRESDGQTMRSPDGSLAIPYTWTAEQEVVGRLRSRWQIGPLPVAMAALSIPLDLRRDRITAYGFSGVTRHWTGCAYTWEVRESDRGEYGAILTPCLIVGVGPVGNARTDRPVSTFWAEGPGIRVTREIQAPTYAQAAAHEHPHSRNLEALWAEEPIGAAPLPAGSRLVLEETVAVEA